MTFPFTRRRFLNSLALGASVWTVPGAFAEELTRTPKQTEGPFYPDKLPLDTDNDLLVDFAPIPDSRIGELTARFDIVLGVTSQDNPKAG